MRFVFLGPPGAGKGTLAGEISGRCGVVHISTGGILRAAIQKQTALGKKVQKVVEVGGLVDDQTVTELVRERVSHEDVVSGFILDGFPRTVTQARCLEDIVPIDYAVSIVVPDDVLVARLTGRRVCSACGSSYHVLFAQPKREGVCDRCRGVLVVREDDKMSAILQRLTAYRAQAEPIVHFYSEREKLVSLNGAPPISDVVLEFQERFAQSR